MFSHSAKILAEVSLQLWITCRKLGHPASVHLSYAANKGSLSRYLTTDHFTIRLSDHPHRDDSKWDHQLIANNSDDLDTKMKEAMLLLERLLGANAAAAA